MNGSGPHSPHINRPHQHSLLPAHAQLPESAQLLRPLGALHQQQHKPLRQWNTLLQQLVSRKAAFVFYTLLALALLWYVGAGRAKPAAPPQSTIISSGSSNGDRHAPQQIVVAGAAHAADSSQGNSADMNAVVADSSSSSRSSTDSQGGVRERVRCPYGALPGTWVSSAPPGGRWQVLDANCQLKNLLAQYASTAQASGDRAADAAAQGTHSSSSSSTTDSSSEVLPAVNMLLLSDSVDRYVLQHVCDYLHGVKHTIRAREEHMQPAAPEAAAPDSDAAQQETAAVTDAGEGPTTAAAGEGPASVVAAEQQAVAGSNSETAAEGSSSVVTGDSSSPAAVAGAADSREPQSASQQAAASPGGGPSSLNATAYAFHTCELPGSVPLKLASSYFPGVHPIGPFHRGLTQNYSARISAAAAMWEEYAGAGQPPHVVGVASALWDVARLWKHERQQLDGQELSRPLLDSWVANFSGVVHYAKTQVPQAQLWVTHTTMLPAYDITTGTMTKPYLGRRYFIEQLNAAAATAARQLDMQLVDYAAVSSRFREGQQHLTDLIHPNAELSLEVFNVLLNLVVEMRGL